MRLTTRYTPRPGSNVGAIVATAGGKTHRRTVDQSARMEANHREAAVTLAARLGYAADQPTAGRATDTPGVYVWELTSAEPLHDYTRAADGSTLTPWDTDKARELRATAGRMFADHGHDGYWDQLTRSACGTCALHGYGASDDAGQAPFQPNHAGWERLYVQCGRLIPREYRPAMRRALSPDTDNRMFRDALARDILTFGVLFDDGAAL